MQGTTVEQNILAGLADLLDLPPDQTPAAVLTKLAEQLGCDVSAGGTLTVRDEPDASDESDGDASEQVSPCHCRACVAQPLRHPLGFGGAQHGTCSIYRWLALTSRLPVLMSRRI